MSNGTDDTTIGRGGWALVVASGVISFVVLYYPMHYQLFPSVAFALAIALTVLLILYRLAVAVNRHDDAENERQVRKIVPASSLGEGTTRVRGVEGASASTVVAVPVRPDPAAAAMRPVSVVTPLSRVEPAPILPAQPVVAASVPPVAPEPSPAASEPVDTFPEDTFADLPDVWARPAPTPAAAAKPKAGFKTKADLVAAAAAAAGAKTKAEPKPKAAAKAKAEPKVKAEVKPKPEPKAEPKPEPKAEPKAEPKLAPKPDPKPKAEVKPKVEATPKVEAKPKAPAKAAAKPKAAKPVPAGLVRLSAPRGGVADDLKEIEGIGPAIEKLINGLGFYHFDQLAAWTDEDVAKVDAELRTFKGRIERDKWVAQARIIVTEGLMAFRERAKTNDY